MGNSRSAIILLDSFISSAATGFGGGAASSTSYDRQSVRYPPGTGNDTRERGNTNPYTKREVSCLSSYIKIHLIDDNHVHNRDHNSN